MCRRGVAVYEQSLFLRRLSDPLQFDRMQPEDVARLPCVRRAVEEV